MTTAAAESQNQRHYQTQMEHLQAKVVGTGHADTSKHEWLTNQHRDTRASLVSHRMETLSWMACIENESVERVRIRLLNDMVQPCGPVPESTTNPSS